MLHSHLGIYALITNEQNQILLIKKARGPYTGLYDLPGGSMEDSELIEETLHREVLEETSCRIQSFTELGSSSILYQHGADTLRHIGILFEAKITGEPKTGTDGEDSAGCVWLRVDDVNDENTTPFVRIALNKKGPY